jgi:hypothetical protein
VNWEYEEDMAPSADWILPIARKPERKGWELVSVLPLYMDGGKFRLIFKRETPDPPQNSVLIELEQRQLEIEGGARETPEPPAASTDDPDDAETRRDNVSRAFGLR